MEQPRQAVGECHLLKVPREMRDQIYGHLFACEASAQLLEAKPPEKAILSTCGQIYDEAKQVYKVSYRSFWKDTEFIVNVTDEINPVSLPRLVDWLENVSDESLAQIETLHIISCSFYHNVTFKWEFRCGIWVEAHSAPEEQSIACGFYVTQPRELGSYRYFGTEERARQFKNRKGLADKLTYDGLCRMGALAIEASEPGSMLIG